MSVDPGVNVRVKGRIMYPVLSVPRQMPSDVKKGSPPSYEATIVIAVDDPQVASLKKMLEAQSAMKFPGEKAVAMPLKPDEKNENLVGMLKLRAKSGEKYPPKVYNMQQEVIGDPTVIEDGDYGWIGIRFFDWKTDMGECGFSASLEYVIQGPKGPGRLGKSSSVSVEDAFAGLDPDADWVTSTTSPTVAPTVVDQSPFNF